MYKYGFIGCGNMAGAIIAGLIRNGLAGASDIIGSAPTESGRRKAAGSGITVTADNLKVCGESETVFLAVKPGVFRNAVSKEIRGAIPAAKPVISIMAGVSMKELADSLGNGNDDPGRKIVRVIPNTPVLAGEGMSVYCMTDSVTQDERKQVSDIFTSFGKAEEIAESLFDAVTAVSGSSPAYVFMFIEAMADGAVACGVPRDKAYEFSAQAVLGSAKMVLETGMHPGALKDMVTSPAGTTIEAVRVLEAEGFRSAVTEAVIACCEKSKSL